MVSPDQRTSRRLFEEGSSRTGSNKAELPRRSELLPGSSLYPRQLLELAEAPKKLYTLGNAQLLSCPSLAIVGARKATAYGLECAERFARQAAARGITVVSGGAIGCDMAAHRGALKARGSTIVVLGSGADVVYPLRARSLYREVLASGGTLLSEAPWGSAPLAWAFAKRNRIIAALARATLIVEAGLPSGTFQTADHTLALGNEVLVVPGPIFSNTCKGTNRLLLQGAIPIVDDESFDDTLTRIFGPAQRRSFEETLYYTEQTGQVANTATSDEGSENHFDLTIEHLDLTNEPSAIPKESTNLNPEEIKRRQMTEHILADLSANPMTIDALASAYKKNTVEIVRLVTALEIQGMIERLRDGRYMTRPPKVYRLSGRG